jgi:hypothetical protein
MSHPLARLLLAALPVLAAPVQAQEVRHPAEMMTAASQAFAAGEREEATFLFYRAQLRWRARLIAEPDASGDGALFGAMFETLGPPINEWAWGDVHELAATIDRVLAEDAADPDPSIPPAAYAESRAGLVSLRDQMIREEASIRAQRAENGLPNR